jgi:hypothetical protein
MARHRSLAPDTVLIDGRLRVAFFLYSLVSARVGTGILFDDHLDRPQYFVVEKFCSLESRHGRMGSFTTTKHFSIPDICDAIAQYWLVWG